VLVLSEAVLVLVLVSDQLTYEHEHRRKRLSTSTTNSPPELSNRPDKWDAEYGDQHECYQDQRPCDRE